MTKDDVLRVLKDVMKGEEYGHAKAAIAIAMQHIAALPEPSAEPVAWRVDIPAKAPYDRPRLFFYYPPNGAEHVEGHRRMGHSVMPLYAAPPEVRQEPKPCPFGCTTQEEHDAHYASPPSDREDAERWQQLAGYMSAMLPELHKVHPGDVLDVIKSGLAAIDAARKREGA